MGCKSSTVADPAVPQSPTGVGRLQSGSSVLTGSRTLAPPKERSAEKDVIKRLEGELRDLERCEAAQQSGTGSAGPKSVLMIGVTGAGKSSLAACLSGTQVKGADGLWSSSIFPIGHQSNPETNTITRSTHNWFGDPAKSQVEIIDTPGLGDPRPGKDEEHLRLIMELISQLQCLHAVMVVLDNKVRLDNTVRMMLELLEKGCSSAIWAHVIVIVNKWPHDVVSKKKRHKGDMMSSDRFENELRQVLAAPKRADSIEEDAHFGLGMDPEVAMRVSFYFVDTNYDREDYDESSSIEEQFTQLRTQVDTSPPARLTQGWSSAKRGAVHELMTCVRSFKVDRLEAALRVAQQSGALSAASAKATKELLGQWQDEVQVLREAIDAAWQRRDPEELQQVADEIMASPLGRHCSELRDELRWMQQRARSSSAGPMPTAEEVREFMSRWQQIGPRPEALSPSPQPPSTADAQVSGSKLVCTFKYPMGHDGSTLESFDVQEATCGAFAGLLHGDVVLDQHGHVITIIGVHVPHRLTGAVLFGHQNGRKGASACQEPQSCRKIGSALVKEGGPRNGLAPGVEFIAGFLQQDFRFRIGKQGTETADFDRRPEICELVVGRPGLVHGAVVLHQKQRLVVVGVLYDVRDCRVQLWLQAPGMRGAGVLSNHRMHELELTGQVQELRTESGGRSIDALQALLQQWMELQKVQRPEPGKPAPPGKPGPTIEEVPDEEMTGRLVAEVVEAVEAGRDVDMVKLTLLLQLGADAKNAKDAQGVPLLLRLLKAPNFGRVHLDAAKELVTRSAGLEDEWMPLVVEHLAKLGMDAQEGFWFNLLRSRELAGPVPPTPGRGAQELLADVILLRNSGCPEVNGLYHRSSDTRSGKPFWVRKWGAAAYAVAYGVAGPWWGVFEEKFEPEKEVFKSEAKTDGVPVSGWSAKDGRSAVPSFSAWSEDNPRGKALAKELMASHMNGTEPDLVIIKGALKDSACCGLVSEVSFIYFVLANVAATEGTALAAVKLLLKSGLQGDPGPAARAFEAGEVLRRVLHLGELQEAWVEALRPVIPDLQERLETAYAVARAVVGTPVTVTADKATIRSLARAEHAGGWNANMEGFVGKRCIVHCVLQDRMCVGLRAEDGQAEYYFHPMAAKALSAEGQVVGCSYLALNGSTCGIKNGIFFLESTLRNNRASWMCRAGEGWGLTWDVEGCGAWGLYEAMPALEKQVHRSKAGTLALPTTGWERSSGGGSVQLSFSPIRLDVSPGDAVRVTATAKELRVLAEGYGGWVDKMAESCGRMGYVESAQEGIVSVLFENNTRWSYNPKALAVVAAPLNKAFITVRNSGVADADRSYQRKAELMNGRPLWHNSKGVGYAIVWNIGGKPQWGLYADKFSLDCQLYFCTEAGATPPLMGWKRTKGSSAVLILRGRDGPRRMVGKQGSDDPTPDKRVKDLLGMLMKLTPGQSPGSLIQDQDLIPDEMVFVDHQAKLGEGGLGVVFKGEFTGTVVACKAVNKSHLGERDQLIEECKLLRHLGHPNVIQVFGVCDKSSQLYIVMQYCERGSLDSVMKSAPKEELQLWRRMQMAMDMCSALEYLHVKQVCHGDLKPANVLVTQGYTCKLGDFGLALFMPKDASKVHARGLTPAFAAPELRQGQKVDGYAADVYSHGICLYEALSASGADSVRTLSFSDLALDHDPGEASKVGSDLSESAPATGAQTGPQALNWFPGVPVPAQDMVRRCWERQPEQRPKAAELKAPFQLVLEV